MNARKKAVILDYGTGNLNSVKKACEFIGLQVEICSDLSSLSSSDCLIFPGQGAYGAVVCSLRKKNLIDPLTSYVKEKRPLLGICIGFQLLFTKSEEASSLHGLGLFEGIFRRFDNTQMPVPHMGWNTVKVPECLSGILPSNLFYFVHSYYTDAIPNNSMLGFTNYGINFTSMIYQQPNLLATQFHPEKSGEAGLALLEHYFEHIER